MSGCWAGCQGLFSHIRKIYGETLNWWLITKTNKLSKINTQIELHNDELQSARLARLVSDMVWAFQVCEYYIYVYMVIKWNMLFKFNFYELFDNKTVLECWYDGLFWVMLGQFEMAKSLKLICLPLLLMSGWVTFHKTSILAPF